MNLTSFFPIVFIAGMVFSQTSLNGTQWQLRRLGSSPAPLYGFVLGFTSDTSARSAMQINSCFYTYQADATTIRFKYLTCTAAVFSPDETRYFALLDSVTHWSRAGNKLYLRRDTDTLLQYVDNSVVELTGKIWQLQSIYSAGGQTLIPQPENYRAVFDTAGTLTLQADCNTCGGSFTSFYDLQNRGGSLTISPLACTEKGCGPGSMGGQYATIMSTVTTYRLSGDSLFCFAGTDRLAFKRAPVAVRGPSAGSVVSNRLKFQMCGRLLKISRQKQRIITKVSVFDLTGSCCLRKDCGESEAAIPLDAVPAGYYVIEAVFIDGTRIAEKIRMTLPE